MDTIVTVLVLIVVLFGAWLVALAVKAGSAAVKAAGRTAIGKGTFRDNFHVELKGLDSLTIRLKKERTDDEYESLLLRIEGRGVIPVQTPTKVGFITSVFDKADGELNPVLTHVDSFQEAETVAYQYLVDVGMVFPDSGFRDWASIGLVIPEILEPPFGGQRKLLILLRMVNLNRKPDIELGFGKGEIWFKEIGYVHNFNVKGYKELQEEELEGKLLVIKIGVSVAMVDGILHESEARALKKWVRKIITTFSRERRSDLRKLFTGTMKDAYREAKVGDLVLSDITRRLNEIDSDNIKLNAIELAFNVMFSDGKTETNELDTITKIAKSLGVDYEELERFKDKNILKLNSTKSTKINIEVLLGIKPDWDKEEIDTHLKALFYKWNGRLNTLGEGTGRDQAQRMIDLIGEYRKNNARSL
jgi:tellurite resistance protein